TPVSREHRDSSLPVCFEDIVTIGVAAEQIKGVLIEMGAGFSIACAPGDRLPAIGDESSIKETLQRPITRVGSEALQAEDASARLEVGIQRGLVTLWRVIIHAEVNCPSVAQRIGLALCLGGVCGACRCAFLGAGCVPFPIETNHQPSATQP